MTDSYSGSFRPKEASSWRKLRQWRGILRLEDTKLIFIYDNGNRREIKYEEILGVRHNTAIITLKNRRIFIFYPRVGTSMVGFGTVEGNIDRMNKQLRIIKEVNNLLNYLITK